MTVLWTASAVADLGGIQAYIAKDSRHYAKAVIDRLTGRCAQIAAFPMAGQMVPEYQRNDIREVVVFSYRMIYLVGESVTWILAVVHGAKSLPDDPPDGP